jgi:hypothetical protein
MIGRIAVKALRVWAGWVFELLYLAALLALPLASIIGSSDPLGTAISYLVPATIFLSIVLPLAFAFSFLQAHLSPLAFRTLNIVVAAVLLFVLLLIWRATEQYGGQGDAFGRSWTAIVAIATAEHPVPLLVGLAAPIAAWLGLGGAFYGGTLLAATRLSGDTRLAAYLGLAALAAFGVLVVMPAFAEYTDGRASNGLNLATGLLLWRGMVVPVVGVLIAYRRIGDGRS